MNNLADKLKKKYNCIELEPFLIADLSIAREDYITMLGVTTRLNKKKGRERWTEDKNGNIILSKLSMQYITKVKPSMASTQDRFRKIFDQKEEQPEEQDYNSLLTTTAIQIPETTITENNNE